jgi:hypothetical protein
MRAAFALMRYVSTITVLVLLEERRVRMTPGSRVDVPVSPMTARYEQLVTGALKSIE